jgi:hypothetical protein
LLRVTFSLLRWVDRIARRGLASLRHHLDVLRERADLGQPITKGCAVLRRDRPPFARPLRVGL